MATAFQADSFETDAFQIDTSAVVSAGSGASSSAVVLVGGGYASPVLTEPRYEPPPRHVLVRRRRPAVRIGDTEPLVDELVARIEAELNLVMQEQERARLVVRRSRDEDELLCVL